MKRALLLLLAPLGILLAAVWPRGFGRLFLPRRAR